MQYLLQLHTSMKYIIPLSLIALTVSSNAQPPLSQLIASQTPISTNSANSLVSPRNERIGIGCAIEPKDGKNVITSVAKTSGAEAAGLAVNDVMLSVNETDVSKSGLEDISNLTMGAPDTTVKVTILRDGRKKMDFTITRMALDYAAIIKAQNAKWAQNLGKPLPVKFTAVDGREVDLSAMKGKVVLLDFWATWCGPCVAEIPHVKEAYDKYHEKGLEVVGISFDKDKAALEKYTKDHAMPWPQYFDGKEWQNKFGEQFDIKAIPQLWLIGKDGNLADINGSKDLAEKVQKLLESK
jgi:thiol-disulfide isomerase/thioredoxin